MKPEDGRTQSIWSDVEPQMPEAPWAGEADVIVVGAGISGLTAAYLLAGDGRSVTLIDEGPIARGQSERTSAHLASILDDRFTEVEKLHDTDTARLAHDSHAGAILTIEQIMVDEQIDCGFKRVDAYLFDGPPPTDVKLDDEYAAARRCGVHNISWVENPGGVKTGRAIRFGHQAIFHPTKYLDGLAKAAAKRGVKFRTGTRVMDASGRQKETPPTVTLADNSKLTAKVAIVVATNTPTPINDWLSIYLKQAAYRTYMVGHVILEGSVPNALYWDTHDPYHYTRLTQHNGQTVLITGGEDHKTGQRGASEDRFDELTKWVRTVFPQAGEEVIRWSGQVQEPSDGLGVIGKAPTKGDDVYVITGDSGMGLTHGTLGAKLISDLIAGRPNPYVKIYDPNRHLMNREALKEDLNANAQYIDYVTPGDIKSPDDLKPGEGGLMRQGLKKLAVYKDEQGQVHQCSSVCPHLGGIVQWNPVEKSWDCPVHGSRFTCTGELLIGPSTDDLAKVE
ncbi:MAG TPA: FAD-dependent oxidoreductase [Tepidisphaeraceae bacterium]|jgi:glycine/D-amino acid oxidase-like deaminating enzyme/nitrite reductase/ring-hydroxylating ferredoxin subunit